MHYLTENSIKLLVTVGMGCVIIKNVPKENLSQVNILVIALIVLLTYVLIDRLFLAMKQDTYAEGFAPTKEQCGMYNNESNSQSKKCDCGSDNSEESIPDRYSGHGRAGGKGSLFNSDGTMKEQNMNPTHGNKPDAQSENVTKNDSESGNEKPDGYNDGIGDNPYNDNDYANGNSGYSNKEIKNACNLCKAMNKDSCPHIDNQARTRGGNAHQTGGLLTTSKTGSEDGFGETGSNNVKHLPGNQKIRSSMDPFDDRGYNDMKYSEYNQVPVPKDYKTTDYEYGYSFLPPEKWYPDNRPLRPPMCVTDRRSQVSPVLTDGAPTDMKEWYDSTRITGPQNINTNYIDNRVNRNDGR
jgi:hypothetical protein